MNEIFNRNAYLDVIRDKIQVAERGYKRYSNLPDVSRAAERLIREVLTRCYDENNSSPKISHDAVADIIGMPLRSWDKDSVGIKKSQEYFWFKVYANYLLVLNHNLSLESLHNYGYAIVPATDEIVARIALGKTKKSKQQALKKIEDFEKNAREFVNTVHIKKSKATEKQTITSNNKLSLPYVQNKVDELKEAVKDTLANIKRYSNNGNYFAADAKSVIDTNEKSILASKLPEFNDNWPMHLKNKWFTAFDLVAKVN